MIYRRKPEETKSSYLMLFQIFLKWLESLTELAKKYHTIENDSRYT